MEGVWKKDLESRIFGVIVMGVPENKVGADIFDTPRKGNVWDYGEFKMFRLYYLLNKEQSNRKKSQNDAKSNKRRKKGFWEKILKTWKEVN